VKKSVSPQKQTHLNDGVPTDSSQIRDNIYSPQSIPLGIDIVLSESEIALPTEKKSSVVSNFWSNVSLGTSKSLTADSRISSSVLAKRLGFSLCQIFELIEAGSIICRNGLIPAEEAERLLQPKIEKV
jgi:hypothetical protein